MIAEPAVARDSMHVAGREWARKQRQHVETRRAVISQNEILPGCLLNDLIPGFWLNEELLLQPSNVPVHGDAAVHKHLASLTCALLTNARAGRVAFMAQVLHIAARLEAC